MTQIANSLLAEDSLFVYSQFSLGISYRALMIELEKGEHRIRQRSGQAQLEDIQAVLRAHREGPYDCAEIETPGRRHRMRNLRHSLCREAQAELRREVEEDIREA